MVRGKRGGMPTINKKIELNLYDLSKLFGMEVMIVSKKEKEYIKQIRKCNNYL